VRTGRVKEGHKLSEHFARNCHQLAAGDCAFAVATADAIHSVAGFCRPQCGHRITENLATQSGYAARDSKMSNIVLHWAARAKDSQRRAFLFLTHVTDVLSDFVLFDCRLRGRFPQRFTVSTAPTAGSPIPFDPDNCVPRSVTRMFVSSVATRARYRISVLSC
jgi:hypothetical protein